jgi:hypothetical protein
LKNLNELLKEFFINFEIAFNSELTVINFQEIGGEVSDSLNQEVDAGYHNFYETVHELIQYLQSKKILQSDREKVIELLRCSASHVSAHEEFEYRLTEVILRVCYEASRYDILDYFIQISDPTGRDERVLFNMISLAISGTPNENESEYLFDNILRKLHDFECFKKPACIIEKEITDGQSMGINIKKFPTRLHQILFHLIMIPNAEINEVNLRMLKTVLKEKDIDSECKIHILYELNNGCLGSRRRNIFLHSYAENILSDLPLGGMHLDEKVVEGIRMTLFDIQNNLGPLMSQDFFNCYKGCGVVDVMRFFSEITSSYSEFNINNLSKLLKESACKKLIKWIDNCSGFILSPADKATLVNIIAVSVFIEHESLPIKPTVKMLVPQFAFNKEKKNAWVNHPLFDKNLIKNLHELIGYSSLAKYKKMT